MNTITIIDENSESCDFTPVTRYVNPQAPVCACNPGGPPPGGFCPPPQTAVWNEVLCQYECQGGTPIIIDLDGDGYNLTNAANGVRFDLAGIGVRERWSWTERGSDEAFLALDRNGDGVINNGKELFGNFTDQPVTEEPNGFIALAMFDDNNDRWIDTGDAIYSRLLLWVDSNHDGVSQRGELHSLEWEGVERIGLDYRISRRSDQHGNNFRYRAKVEGRDLGRWAWDVILLRGN
ncbi:MAG: hypothetical protein SF097_23960 [Acidobacteriota bacterium]|nr:hypothetical protein [Acidobacteriota bacterium]